MLKDFFHLQNLQKVFNYYFGVLTKEKVVEASVFLGYDPASLGNGFATF
jgi:hypothetical protein